MLSTAQIPIHLVNRPFRIHRRAATGQDPVTLGDSPNFVSSSRRKEDAVSAAIEWGSTADLKKLAEKSAADA